MAALAQGEMAFVVAPLSAAMPHVRAAVNEFNRVMNELLGSAEVRKLYFELGEEPAIGSPEDFGRLIREDYEKMGRLVKVAGIKPD